MFKSKPEEFKKRMETVSSKVPESFLKAFDEHLKKEYASISDYIRDLIRKDLKKRNLL